MKQAQDSAIRQWWHAATLSEDTPRVAGHRIPCSLAKVYSQRVARGRRLGWLVCLLVCGCLLGLGGGLPRAMGAEHPPELLTRGYARLAQARLETPGAQRERLLQEAIAAMKDAYQTSGARVQLQALLGAAQSYLLIQTPRRVFPFLWQATPLQRAEKNLHQALVLQPENAAAKLLLGMVYQRLAAQTPAAPAAELARARTAWEQAAALGVPVRLPDTAAPRERPEVPLFSAEDTLWALVYVEARATGNPDDLVFIYQPAGTTRLVGVVIAVRQAYPLVADAATQTLAPSGEVESVRVESQDGQPPVLLIAYRQDAQRVVERFTWDSSRFVRLPAQP